MCSGSNDEQQGRKQAVPIHEIFGDFVPFCLGSPERAEKAEKAEKAENSHISSLKQSKWAFCVDTWSGINTTIGVHTAI